MSLNKLSSRYLINSSVFIVIIVIFFAAAWWTGLLTSGFRYFIDDSQIVLMHQDLSEHGYFDTLIRWVQYDRSVARFRPVYQVNIVTLTRIFGLNSTFWFAYITLLGGLTAFFLFCFGRLLNFSISISLIFSISTLLGWQSEIWARPLIPDAYGMFFLSTALVFLGLSYRSSNSVLYKYLFVVSTLLMSLCKESYIIFIPFLIFLNVFLFSRFNQVSLGEGVIKTKDLSLVLTFIFALELIYVIFFLGTGGTGYAGVDESSFQIRSILLAGYTFLQHSLLEIAFLGLAVFFVLQKIRREPDLSIYQELAYFFVLLILALVPQILLYSKSGITAGFYLFPAIVVASLFIAKSLSFISQGSRHLGLLLVILTSMILLSKIPAVLAVNTKIAQDSRYMNKMLEQVEICADEDQKILVVVNPRVRYEAADALQRVLRKTAGRNNLLIATYGLDKTQFYSNFLEEVEKQFMFLDPQSMDKNYQNETILDLEDKNEIKVIIVFDKLDTEFSATNKDWFDPQGYQLTEFDISFSPVSLYCRK